VLLDKLGASAWPLSVLLMPCEPVQAADKHLTEVLSQAAAHVASEPIPDVLADVRKGWRLHNFERPLRPLQQPVANYVPSQS